MGGSCPARVGGPGGRTCDGVARELPDRPGPNAPTRARREEPARGGDRHRLATRPRFPSEPDRAGPRRPRTAARRRPAGVGDPRLRPALRGGDQLPGRGHGRARPGPPRRPGGAGAHAGHRPPAGGDPRGDRGDKDRARPHRGGGDPGPGRGGRDGRPQRPLPVPPGPGAAPAVLPRPQGRAAGARPGRPGRLGHGAAPRRRRCQGRHPQGGAGRRPRRHRQAEPAGRLVARAGVGVRARQPPARQRAVRARLHLDRLRALHPPDPAG
jgi:hypothetical protein